MPGYAASTWTGVLAPAATPPAIVQRIHGTIAESVDALLAAGSRPEITVAATHALLLDGARDKLSREGIHEIVVTDTLAIDQPGWSGLRVVTVAPLIAGALRRFLANGSLRDLS